MSDLLDQVPFRCNQFEGDSCESTKKIRERLAPYMEEINPMVDGYVNNTGIASIVQYDRNEH